MLDFVSLVPGVLSDALKSLGLATSPHGKYLAIVDSVAALDGYDSDAAIGHLIGAAVQSGLDQQTIRRAVSHGRERAEAARQYREAAVPPKQFPVVPAASNDDASPSLREALRIQAQERAWLSWATSADNLDAVAVPTKTAPTTIEALLYELRDGLSCLANEGALDRLRRCDRAAMRTIAAEMESWECRGKPWLPAWSTQDVAKLLKIWRGLK
jgi:hypothetical protein